MKQPNFKLIFFMLCLGYLIDYYDLSLFAVTRPAILKELNIPTEQTLTVSNLMFNAQSLGIIIGGVLSGVWGDKIGRVSAIRAGIFIYSSALVLNVFAHTVTLFALCRFFAGLGLAGELAASVTLLCEMTPHSNRGLLASIVYMCGIVGGIFSTIVATVYSWKTLFVIGGVSGFVVLLLRTALVDPVLFLTLKEKAHVPRGNLLLLLNSPKKFFKILRLSFLIVPMWFGVFFTNYAPEIARGLGMTGKISIPYCLGMFFGGSFIGALIFSYLGKTWQSRKKTIGLGVLILCGAVIALCTIGAHSEFLFSNLFVIIGMSTGYFGIYMTFLAENFGTNQRSTGTTLVSNLGRSSFILINSCVPVVIHFTQSTRWGSVGCALAVILVSVIAIVLSPETYEMPLDYIEGESVIRL